jgi:hypothetical protein
MNNNNIFDYKMIEKENTKNNNNNDNENEDKKLQNDYDILFRFAGNNFVVKGYIQSGKTKFMI